jgi:hypothetical protein
MIVLAPGFSRLRTAQELPKRPADSWFGREPPYRSIGCNHLLMRVQEHPLVAALNFISDSSAGSDVWSMSARAINGATPNTGNNAMDSPRPARLSSSNFCASPDKTMACLNYSNTIATQ